MARLESGEVDKQQWIAAVSGRQLDTTQSLRKIAKGKRHVPSISIAETGDDNNKYCNEKKALHHCIPLFYFALQHDRNVEITSPWTLPSRSLCPTASLRRNVVRTEECAERRIDSL